MISKKRLTPGANVKINGYTLQVVKAGDMGVEVTSVEYLDEPEHCTACERELNPERIVWFEMNARTFEVWEENKGTPPAWAGTEDSQGCFPYGPCCARKVRKAGRAIFA